MQLLVSTLTLINALRSHSHSPTLAHSMLSLKVPHKEVRSFIHKWCMFYSLNDQLVEQLVVNIIYILLSLLNALLSSLVVDDNLFSSIQSNFNTLVVSLADDEKETTKKLQKEAWLEQKREVFVFRSFFLPAFLLSIFLSYLPS